ncbi:hypothetical protein [Lysinibacillus fusiformis]|uniref:hypothetical protein n=1 Tax=Lysinibacillus fusiformis TaxID=28031 RepID=UPI0013B43D68|nr:hypothetical protein [Lysinibacillus fusiformis]
MNPVVGLDVSKGESQVQAFLDKICTSISFPIISFLEGRNNSKLIPHTMASLK